MQMEQSLFKSASNVISGKLHQLLTDDFAFSRSEIALLNPQPSKQRHDFLARTIKNQLTVFVQLTPRTDDGYPVNVHGTIKNLTNNQYLIKNHNVSYLVGFDQIRYIANL